MVFCYCLGFSCVWLGLDGLRWWFVLFVVGLSLVCYILVFVFISLLLVGCFVKCLFCLLY